MFFGKAESLTLDGQGRLLVPQRLRNEAGIGKEAVVLGVSGPDGDLGPVRPRALRGGPLGRLPGGHAPGAKG